MTWEPATETERRMQDVLRQGDQESYFLLLSGGDLYIPVAPGNAAWATWSTEDRTHVLAFTSEAALRSCLREHAGQCRRIRLEELVHSWPDEEWWLAINPGLPIEGYLPAWFVTQVSTGDVSLPVEGGSGDARVEAEPELMPAYGGGYGFEERGATGYEQPAYQQPAYAPEPRFGEEQPTYPEYSPTPEPVRHQAFAPPEPAFAPPEPSYAPPEPSYGPPEPSYPPPEPAYQPAAFQGDRYPAEPSYAPEPGYEDGRGYQSPHLDDAYQPEHPPYGVTGESAYEPAALPELPPEPALAPSPLPTRSPAPAPEYAASGPTEDEVENELAAAGAAGDTPRFLHALLSGWVYVPLNDDSPTGVRPGDPDFTWRTDLIDGAYSLTVFTSPTRMSRRLGPCEFVKVTFVRVARYWPDRSYSLAINPGTEVGANMPGTQMSTLINWAGKKGLIERADLMEDSAEAAYGNVVAEDLSAGGYAPPAGQERKLGPTLMQKLIPAAQVPFYLQRGYDRIAGFVHPAEDLADFDTPESLRTALGLIHDGASDVYVIRWISHRADLYRIPYGGTNEDEMRRMEGWVIESPPFRGNGFAPGDAGAVVAEFKVDSIRLPHGATMHRLSSIDGDTLVASFDADQQTWLTAEEPL